MILRAEKYSAAAEIIYPAVSDIGNFYFITVGKQSRYRCFSALA